MKLYLHDNTPAGPGEERGERGSTHCVEMLKNRPSKPVKYKVTGSFGDHHAGDIVDAYVLFKDGDNHVVLLYHPDDDHSGCASIEFARKDGRYYVSLDPHGDGYVNLNKKQYQALEGLFWTVLPRLKGVYPHA